MVNEMPQKYTKSQFFRETEEYLELMINNEGKSPNLIDDISFLIEKFLTYEKTKTEFQGWHIHNVNQLWKFKVKLKEIHKSLTPAIIFEQLAELKENISTGEFATDIITILVKYNLIAFIQQYIISNNKKFLYQNFQRLIARAKNTKGISSILQSHESDPFSQKEKGFCEFMLQLINHLINFNFFNEKDAEKAYAYATKFENNMKGGTLPEALEDSKPTSPQPSPKDRA